MSQPIQPLYTDEKGVLRFKENAIVRYLLDRGGIDLNQIARSGFSDEDRVQFAQLIGYSLSGFCSLGYVNNEAFEAAELMSTEGLDERDARIKYLQETLDSVKDSVRSAAVTLFEIHPDDLT